MLRSVLLAAATAFLGVQATATHHTRQSNFSNPVLYEDFPDNDVSVGPDGAYYFSASSFHFSPGAPILRSWDLINWEFVGHSVPRLNFGSGYDLPPDGERQYRGGIWASTLRYRKSNGLWYWIGCTNFWITWVFTAKNITGPWTQAGNLGGGVCFYDNGLLIDDDDSLYVVYTTNSQVNVSQLASDGLSVVRSQEVILPQQVNVTDVEGNRFYKINGTYYILNDNPGSAAYLWKSSSPWGPYEGKALAYQVPSPVPGGGYPHQGSLIETPKGWYFMSFTWAYPSGRLPVLAPIEWGSDGFATVVTAPNGSWAESYPLPLPAKPRNFAWTRTYDFTTLTTLPPDFEWNHNPDTTNYTLASPSSKALTLSAASVTNDLYQARNTLTHRAHGEFPVGTVELDVSSLADGDIAGLAAFRDRTSYISVRRNGTALNVTTLFNTTIDEYGAGNGETLDFGHVTASVALPAKTSKVWLRVAFDARADGDHQATFAYSTDGRKWVALGGTYELYTNWGFFLGYRFGIFNYATKALGGKVKVLSFTSA